MILDYGATTEEWETLADRLGLREDLLPVVSNPDAVISEKSKMKDVGKTPSVYNRDRKVAGLPNWTDHKSTENEIKKWMKEPEYGICIQTRRVRALDLDILSTDGVVAVLKFIDEHLRDVLLPIRQRANSSKCLLAFRVDGELAKRRFKVENGIIEFLANGQQFVALGTHPSGVRYTWDWCENDDFPVLSRERFEALWDALVKKFGVEEPTVAGKYRARRDDADIIMPDATLDLLEKEGHILGWGNDGQAFIECPWKGEHTVESGETETCYFPKGSKGYEQGHFKCLHAHCEDRDDSEFLDAFGFREAEFDVVQPETVIDESGKEVVVLDRPIFRRNNAGAILSTADNLRLALERPDVCGRVVLYDSFRDNIMIADEGKDNLRPLTDHDYTAIQCVLERKIGFKPIAIEMMRRVLAYVAQANKIDSAIDWIDKLEWDGKPRIEKFLIDYMQAEDSPYTRAVGLYMWTALAGRVLSPGIKADMVPILEGAQGIMKSSAVRAISPHNDFFCNISFSESEDNLARKMRGKVIAEIGELRGLHTKELEGLKEWVAKPYDEWIPKYYERTVIFPRRLLFIGTTNQKEFLADETGNRRWLPVHVKRVDINGVLRDRDQFWAEAREMFKQHGILYTEAESLATDTHKNYMIDDPWRNYINNWMYQADDMSGTEAPITRGYVQIDEILQHALHLDAKNIKGIEGKRVAKILRGDGFERVKKRVNGIVTWVWAQQGLDLV